MTTLTKALATVTAAAYAGESLSTSLRSFLAINVPKDDDTARAYAWLTSYLAAYDTTIKSA